MDINSMSSFGGLGLSAIALVIGFFNYRNNIKISRRNALLSERKTASEELREHIELLNNVVFELTPTISEIRDYLSCELIELFRSIPQPQGNQFATRPIAHHVSDLAIGLSKEIHEIVNSHNFSYVAGKPIKLLNIVPQKDIYPFLAKREKSDYRSFEYLETKVGATNFAAMCGVRAEGFHVFFNRCTELNAKLEQVISKSKISELSILLEKSILRNKNQVFSIHSYEEFSERFFLVLNLLHLLLNKYNFRHKESVSSCHDLDFGYAAYYVCKFQLLKDICSKYSAQFELDLT